MANTKVSKAKKTTPKASQATSKAAAPKAPKVSTAKPLSLGVGRRKASVARVWLRPGTGKFVVNERDYKDYFDTEIAQIAAVLPFKVVSGAGSKYDVTANVNGGGLLGQADAVKLGLARALVSVDENLRPGLRDHGLLTVDSRIKERKKYGQPSARAKFQFVKR